jgi:hypothetical protein
VSVDAIRVALLREAHRSIAEAADAGLARIANAAPGTDSSGPVALDYPPGDGRTDHDVLTLGEAAALAHIATSAAAMSGLRKLLRGRCFTCSVCSTPQLIRKSGTAFGWELMSYRRKTIRTARCCTMHF